MDDATMLEVIYIRVDLLRSFILVQNPAFKNAGKLLNKGSLSDIYAGVVNLTSIVFNSVVLYTIARRVNMR